MNSLGLGSFGLRRGFLSGLGTLLLLLLPACVNPAQTSLPPETTKYTLENTDRFAFEAGGPAHAISCTGLMELPLADGRLEVVANLKNREMAPVKVQVGCAFKDASGEATIENSPWQNVTLPENATVSVRFTASTPAAKKYTVLVRDRR